MSISLLAKFCLCFFCNVFDATAYPWPIFRTLTRSVDCRGYCPLPTSYICHIPFPRLSPAPALAFNSATPFFLCVSVAKENDTLLTIRLLTVRVTLQLFFWLGFSFIVFYLYLLFSSISLASLSLPICHIHKGRGQRTLLYPPPSRNRHTHVTSKFRVKPSAPASSHKVAE